MEKENEYKNYLPASLRSLVRQKKNNRANIRNVRRLCTGKFMYSVKKICLRFPAVLYAE